MLLHLKDFVKNHSENRVSFFLSESLKFKVQRDKIICETHDESSYSVWLSRGHISARGRDSDTTPLREHTGPSISANDALSARVFIESTISSGRATHLGARIKEKLISPSALDEEDEEREKGEEAQCPRNDPSFRGRYLETPRVEDDRGDGISPLKGAPARKFSRKRKICNSTGVARGIQLSVAKERRGTR